MAKVPWFLQTDTEDCVDVHIDQSIRWKHMSKSTFSHAAVHIEDMFVLRFYGSLPIRVMSSAVSLSNRTFFQGRLSPLCG